MTDTEKDEEIKRLRAALEEIELAGWKERLGAEGAIASHYDIKKIVRKAITWGASDS